MKKINALRPIIFKISLAISIAFVLLILSFSTPMRVFHDDDAAAYEDEFTEVKRTMHKEEKKGVPRVKKEKSRVFTLDTIEFVKEPDVEFDTALVEVDTQSSPFISTGQTATSSKLAAPAVKPPEEDVEPMRFPDKMPVFGDCKLIDAIEQRKCSERALLQYLADHINYPTIAKENRITGRVVLQFVVDKDGSIRDCVLLRDIGGGCGREAIRVVDAMPRWSPGIQRGRPVPVMYTLPVKFALK